MEATAKIRYGFERPVPLPFEFLFAKRFVQKTTVQDKKEGVSLPAGGGYGGNNIGYGTAAYFIFVMTEHGDLRIEVSKKLYDLVQNGDSIFVSYQRGHITAGALRGKIAR